MYLKPFILRLFTLFFFFIQFQLQAQDQWINYTNGKSVNSFADDGTSLWVGTLGGMVKVDKSTGAASFFDKTNSGLPDNRVNAVFVDQSGNVWIGTEFGGLVKYNGEDWIIYTTENSGINGNCIQDVAVDQNGVLWVCSVSRQIEGGYYSSRIIEFDGSTWTIHQPVGSNFSTCIAIDQMNNKWVGSIFGLQKYNGTDWSVWDADNSPMPVDRVTCLAIGQDNKVVMGFDHAGMGIFDGVNTWSILNVNNSSLPNNIVISVAVDPDNAYWIGMNLDGGMARYDGTTWWHWNPAFLNMPGYGPREIMIDSDNRAWIGFFAEGLYSLSGDDWTYFNTSNSGLDYFDNEILSIAIDSNQNKWTGYRTLAGVSEYDGNNWSTYNRWNSEYQGSNVYAIAVDHHDTKWFGSRTGIAKFENDSWTTFDGTNSGLPVDVVMSIEIDENDDLWIGTEGGGLARYDRENWTVYNQSNSGLTDSIVTAINAQDTGIIWVGTYLKGLFKFDGENWSNYDTVNSGIPTNNVTSIKIDDNGILWIGTGKYYGIAGGSSFKGGLSRFDGTSWHNFTKKENGFPSDNVFDIAIDSEGNKWLATSDGLVKHDGSTAVVYDVLNSGMPSYRVYCLEMDEEENLWIGTENGLAFLNRENYNLFFITAQGTDASCENAFDGSASVTTYYGTPDYTYLWDDPGAQTTAQAINLSPGTYTVTVTESHGYSANASVTLTHTNVPPIITAYEGSLLSSSETGNQWYLDNELLAGDTLQTCVPVGNGEYVVVVTESNDCATPSAPYNYLHFGIPENNTGDQWFIVPNPNAGTFVIDPKDGTAIQQKLKLEFYNRLGIKVYESDDYTPGKDIHLEYLPKGIYFARISGKGNVCIKKMIIR